MGSFNAACSVSNISIGPGKPTMFLPLIPPPYVINNLKGKYTINDHMLIYPHCFFHPLCLPIKGKYNDYGSLEDIEEDDNTRAIEAFMGMSINVFIACCTCNRAVHSYIGERFHHFGIVQKELNDYRVPFGDAFLKTMGFRKLNVTGESYYDFERKDFPFLVKLKGVWNDKECGHRMLGLSFDIIDSEGQVVWSCDHYDQKSNIQEAYHHLTRYHINVKDEDQWKVKLFESMSGMFIHGQVYDRLADSPKDILEDWGWGSDKRSFGELYDEFHQALVKYHNKPVPKEPILQAWHDSRGPFDYFEDFHFKLFFREWPRFRDLYEKALLEGKLKESFTKFFDFYRQMYSANRFYFPAMNGEQCGNHKVSKNLAQITLGILEEELEEQRRWEEEDEDEEDLLSYAVEDEHQW